MSLYAFTHYRPVIAARIAANAHVRAYRSVLAKAAGCQRTYLSQVMHGHVHLTLDHGMGLAKHWGYSEDETQYFLDLIAWERAGSRALKRHLADRLARARAKAGTLAIAAPRLGDPAVEARYYASWQYAALHVLASIPPCREPGVMARALGLPLETVRARLADLESMGLLREDEAGAWHVLAPSVHLPPTSPMTAVNHGHWRRKAMARIDERPADGLHYTALHALSAKDARVLRERLLAMVQEMRAVVGPSPEETMVALTMDFWEVTDGV